MQDNESRSGREDFDAGRRTALWQQASAREPARIKSFRRGRVKLFLRRNKRDLAVLALILLVGCFFISGKQGYHMDELLSFELANAEFTPWIVTTQPEGRLEKFVKNEIYGDSFGETWSNIVENVRDVLKNRGESKMLSYQADVYEEPVWITAQQFRDYITTDSRDCFNYLSVYFNVKDDNHPPLHFMALHTVSSIFKGRVEPWMGCSINLVLILGICILLMRICREFLGRTEEFGRAVCVLYALSMAGVATLLLIRMYAMLTFFCMAALYLHMKKRRAGQWRTDNKLLVFVTVCGFLTQYYFVIFMLFLAGVTVVCLWRTERKQLFYYIRTMGISALLGLVMFPFSIMDVLYSERGVESVQNLSGGFSGFWERLFCFLGIVKERVLGGDMGAGILLLVAVAALVSFVIAKLGENSELEKVRRKERERAERRRDDLRWEYYMACVPCFGYFLIVVKIAPYYADRYLMPVFPLMALLAGSLLQKSLDVLKRHLKAFGYRGVLSVLAAFLVLPYLFTVEPEYLYTGYGIQEAVSEEFKDRACLCVYEGVGYYQNLIEFTNYKKTLMVTKEELLSRSFDETFAGEEEMVVLIKGNVDGPEAVGEYLEQEYGYSFQEYLIRGSVHGDLIGVYRK